MLKQSKIILKSLISFCWHPYWSHFIRSLRNVRLNKIHLHRSATGHPMDPNQFSIVHKEVNSQPRTIKEAMFIHVQDPPLNRNLGKYQLHAFGIIYYKHHQHYSASQPTYHPTSHPTTPLLVPPSPFPLPYISPTNTIVGGTPILFPYGKYTCLSQITPPILIYNKSYTSTILVSSFKYFV